MGNKLRLYCFLFVCLNLSSNAQEFTNNETLRATLLRVSGIDSLFEKPLNHAPAQNPHLKSETFYKLDSICTYFMDSETDSTGRNKTTYKYDKYGNLIEEAGYHFSILDKRWGKTVRSRYAYDERGNQILYEYYWGDYEQWYAFDKRVWVYDDDNMVIADTTWLGDDIHPEFKPAYYRTYEYNQNQQKLSELGRVWDENAKTWVNNYWYAYSYNETGDTINVFVSEWNNEHEQWVKTKHTIYSVYPDGRYLWFLSSIYNSKCECWQKYSYEKYDYDSFARKTHQLLQFYDLNLNKWINYRQDYIHFSGVQDYEHIWEVWNVQENTWQSNQKIVARFDESGNQILGEKYNKALNSEIWRGVNKNIAEFNSANQKTLNISYDWDLTISDWIPQSRTDYTYRNNKVYTIELVDWDPVNNQWLNNIKGTYYYDSLLNLSLVINYKWFGMENQWSWPRKEYYYYSYYTDTHSPLVKDASSDVYPNPVETVLHLPEQAGMQTDIQIFNATGKLVLNRTSFNRQVDVSQLQQGIYLLKIKTSNKVYVARFIKK